MGSSRRTVFAAALVLLLVLAAQLVACPQAQAIVVGAESNGQLVNSNVTPQGQAAELDRIRVAGATLVRVNFGWNEMAANCGGQTPAALEQHTNPCYSWDVMDSLVALAQARGLRVLMSTSRAPAWLHGSSDPSYLGTTQEQFERTVAHYAAFMKAAASRHPGVALWTVWNEPNGEVFWHPLPDARRYAQLYAATAVAIKSASAAAQVAPGPTAPKGYRTARPVSFIRSFQAWIGYYLQPRDPAAFIDAWAHNPYPGTSSPWAEAGAEISDTIGMSRIDQLFAVLDESAATRGTPVWATEFGWQTNPPDRRFGVSPARQAQYIPEAYHWFDSRAGRRVTIGINYVVTDPLEDADWQSGLFSAGGDPKPLFRSFQRMLSIPRGVVRRGQRVELWGRSNVDPRGGRIVYRPAGQGAWRTLPGVRRRDDGTMTARVKIVHRRTQFAVWDAAGGGTRGPARTVIGR